MNEAQYTVAALVTEKPLPAIVADKALMVAILTAAVAMGNLIDLAKKGAVYGKDITLGQLEESLGELDDAVNCVYSALYGAETEQEALTVNPRLLHAGLGAFGEEAEFLELLLAQINGETVEAQKFADETGDTQWYGALRLDELQKAFGFSVEQIRAGNIAKLAARHKGKPLTIESSDNRDRAAEAEALSAAL